MGVLIRQSIKGSVYSYLATIVGFVNVGLLMPLLLDQNQIGLIMVLLAISNMMGRFGTLGFPLVIKRLFPYFRTKDKSHNGFLRLLLIFSFAGLIITGIIFAFMKDFLVAKNIEKSPLLADNIFYIIPLLFAVIFKNIFDTYLNVNYKASTATFFKDLFSKSLILADLGIYYTGLISFTTFLNFYIIAFASPAVLMLLYLIYQKQFKLLGTIKNLEPGILKQIPPVAFFGLLTNLGAVAIMNIDKIMINSFFNLSLAGVYSIAFHFGTLIRIPGNSIRKISQAVTSDSLKNNNMAKIQNVYYKSSVNMFFMAATLLIIIWSNIHNILSIIGEEYSEGKYVVFFIGLAFVLNMMGSISNQIIKFSKYYKVEAYIMIPLIAVLILFNLLLIPVFGITGAAISTTLTYLLVSIFRWIFVWRKFGLQPFGKIHLVIFLALTAIYFVISFIPQMSLIPDIVIRNLALLILLGLFTKYSDASPEINSIIETGLTRINNKFRNKK